MEDYRLDIIIGPRSTSAQSATCNCQNYPHRCVHTRWNVSEPVTFAFENDGAARFISVPRNAEMSRSAGLLAVQIDDPVGGGGGDRLSGKGNIERKQWLGGVRDYVQVKADGKEKRENGGRAWPCRERSGWVR